MTLMQAILDFEQSFPEVTSDVRQQFDPSLPVLWSGGRRAFTDPAWALYANKDDAIVEWLAAAKSVSKGSKLKWVVRPELMEFMITIADKNGAHRAVNNRFAVKSQFTTGDE